ncbi:MAG: hypothetical protein ABIF01_04655 [Candidatus Micrarchaeota archaeon]
MKKRAILHYNATKPAALRAKEEVAEFLSSNGFEVLDRHSKKLSTWGETKVPHFIYSDRFRKITYKMGEDARMLMGYKEILRKEKADLLVTIGGDGTLLFYKGLYNLPLFAIGSKTSFLCQARIDNWKPRLERALKNWKIDSSPMLEAKFGSYLTEAAMNEICVKNPRHRMLRFVIKVNGVNSYFGADGVIFSTAIGSSGYAYSAGGREFTNKRRIEIVPVAPHRRRFKPMLVGIDSPIELKILSRYKHDVVDVVIDGQIVYEMGLNASLIIRKSKRSVSMLKVK